MIEALSLSAAAASTDHFEPLLEVSDLRVEFQSYDRVLNAVSGVSFRVLPGEFVGLVGENGSGKSTAALAVMGITRRGGRIVDGSVRLRSRELLTLSEADWRSVRGRQIGFVTQNPRGALNPVLRIGRQIENIYRTHVPATAAQAREHALGLLRLVGINDAERRLDAFPHELSGGMAQRVLIAAALCTSPALLIADEPTTGLDVTVQAQVLDDLRRAATELGTGVLLITHDLGIVANYCDRVYLMHAGEVVEESGAADFFSRPRNPASLSLLAAQLGHADDSLRLHGFPIHPSALPTGCWLHPRCSFASVDAGCTTEHPALLEVSAEHRARCHRAAVVGPEAERHLRVLAEDPTPLRRKQGSRSHAGASALQVRAVTRRFVISEREGLLGRRRRRVLQACSDVSFDAYRGETIGIIGESGSGKTTLARVVCGLLPPTSGEIVVNGTTLTNLTKEERRRLRASLQIVFQEPAESMNPMMTVGQQIVEPLYLLRGLTRRGRQEASKKLLRMVGLSEQLADRIPSTLSGGQLQRASIARAVSTEPSVVVLDEPTAQLSPEAEEHVLQLLNRLQDEIGLTYIYISHDLSLVRSICDRVLIMYLGQIVEMGTTEEIFERPQHPYTRTLVSSILRPDPRQRAERATAERLDGEIPSPIDLPGGCYLAARCRHALDRCRTESQSLDPAPDGRLVRCWRAREGELDTASTERRVS